MGKAISVELLCALLLLGASRAGCQAANPTVFTGDIAWGYANGSGGEYRERTQYFWHIGADARVARVEQAEVLIGVSGDVAQHPGAFIDICQRGSQGQCLRAFPLMRGAALDFGVRQGLGPSITITARAGAGVYHVTDSRDGAAYGTGRVWALSADVAARVSRHVQLLIGGRRLAGADVAGAKLGLSGVSIGVRGR
jgi:hypothetical protein